ncbi:MAG: APC family permease [Acidobacteriota bacterium]
MTPAEGGGASGGGASSRRLRRDLGTLESYAVLVGILVGAGIFRVTSDAWALTGPSLILAYLVLVPAVLATSVAYAVFLSTPLGREPGGEYTHISRTFGGSRVAFVGAWLKVISYVGALAYLANAFGDYAARLPGAPVHGETGRLALAVGSLVFFYLAHVAGVRWFGRLQVAMGALLGVSLVVLVVPGLFAVRPSNYVPFFTHGARGFAASLVPLFFLYAGFESLAHAAGEVRESTSRLPRVFMVGICITTAIYILMSIVAFGVLPGEALRASRAPMSEVAAVYLPAGTSLIVTLGALLALATSLNATMLVPSRLGVMLADDRLAPRWLGAVWARTGTPVRGLTVTLAAAALLLVSGQISLALNIAVLALVVLYFLHSLALFMLPRKNPELFRRITVRIPPAAQRLAALVSMAAMAGLLWMQVGEDLRAIRGRGLRERLAGQSLTSLELAAAWGLAGLVMYGAGRRRAAREARRRGFGPAMNDADQPTGGG